MSPVSQARPVADGASPSGDRPAPAADLEALCGLQPGALSGAAAPGGADGAAALAGALAAELAVTGHAGAATLRPIVAARIVAGACTDLIRTGRSALVLHLADAITDPVGRDQFPVRIARAHALRGLGRYAELQDLLEEIWVRTDPDPKAATAFDQLMNMHRLYEALPNPFRLHDLIWGIPLRPLDWTIEALLAGEGVVQTLPSPLAGALADARGAVGPERATYLRGLQRGYRVARYFLFVRHLSLRLRDLGDAAFRPAERQEIRTLLADVTRRVDLGDASPIRAAADSGRSVVIASAHSGVSLLSVALTNLTGLPTITVSARERPARPGQLHLATSDEGVALASLRIAKRMKAKPHALWIAPDGAVGDCLERRVGGRPVAIGRGAGLIASRSGAATFFVRSVFDDGRFVMRIEPGPVADGSLSHAAFEDAFADFYAARLQALIDGPPEDLAPQGGFFAAFRQPQP